LPLNSALAGALNMTGRTITSVIFILFCSTLSGQDNLVPCQAALGLDSLELTVDARIVENLNLDLSLYPPLESGGWPMARMIVQPGWDEEPESAVTLYLPDNGDGFVEATVANKGIAGTNTETVRVPNQDKPTFTFVPTEQKRVVKTARYRAPISRGTAVEISDILAKNVRSAKFPDDNDMKLVLHGTQYSFVSWILGLGFICGQTSSPDDGTLAGDVVQLGNQLFEYAKADESHRAYILTDIKRSLSYLKSKSAS